MKTLNRFFNQDTACKLSRFMNGVCYVIILLLVIMLVLGFCGRLQYDLRFGEEHYPHAIYAEENHDFSFRGTTVSSNDNLYVRTDSTDGKIELLTYVAIVSMYAIMIIPTIFAYFYLARVFGNVAKGKIFVQQNAKYLLYYGLIQAFTALVVPFAKLLIAKIANMLVSDKIYIATGSDMLNSLIPSIGVLVAAYIIHHGVNLQDEVDHTI